ncbi:MAG: dsrE/DsrF-like family protein [Gammaproteobacteria bacterium]|jgi:intracellular sulfur oxidation DsrE/DsrF family protein|nr:dsrE/DsrF-like family protein [Gammaproteobacteria bacterium]
MKAIQRTVLLTVMLGVSASALAVGDASSQEFWQTPALPGLGKMHPLPKAAYQPQRNETYKVVFSVTNAGSKPDEVNPSLDRVARAVNLYASAGVPLNHLKFVAVMYGAATDGALDNEHYRQKYGIDNPNLDLIRELRNAGVDVAVCGQAAAEHQDQYEWIAPEVTLALSALTTITTLEHQGYGLMPL